VTDGGTAAPTPSAIRARAHAAGVQLSAAAASALAAHARAVIAANARLHLTAITEPSRFLERHLGESLEGAALLPEAIRGPLLDLGSGNGYPGIPLAAARPGLTPTLAEASVKKAAFLREALSISGMPSGQVIEARIARAADLADQALFAVIATRAMGGWERIVPKLVAALAPGGIVLIWAGADATKILARQSWSRLRLVERRDLPGRVRSAIYQFRKD
jgi:16S rRNA (guanine527-N7)-methyltransferase